MSVDNHKRQIWYLFFFLFIFPNSADSASNTVITPHLQAQLIPQHTHWKPGTQTWVALRLVISSKWHTYWKNPGDSGLPTRIQWILPKGFKASEIHWPLPNRISSFSFMDFGYHEEVFLFTRISVPSSSASPSSRTLHAQVKWLVCEDICIPEEGKLSLTLPVSNKSLQWDKKKQPSFEYFLQRLPQPVDQKFFQYHQGGTSLHLEVDKRILYKNKDQKDDWSIEFFPLTPGMIKNTRPPVIKKTKDAIHLTFEMTGQHKPKSFEGVLVARHSKEVIAYSLQGFVEEKAIWSWKILLFAFLGGLLLNFMPCVFPVLALKVLGFLKEEHKTVYTQGVAYSLGVLTTFIGLASVLLLLRAGGEQLGWGFQLQSPPFLILLMFLFFAMGLNLLGFFSFSGQFMGLGSKYVQGSQWRTSFFTGVLAVVVATPCTAPFMGTAMGVALTQPPSVTILIFTFLALGMALPYFLFSLWPSAGRLLPKPGPWMDNLKEFLAFPLLAACIWLGWVLSQQITVGQYAYTLLGLLFFVMSLWVGKKINTGSKMQIILTGLLLVLSFWLALNQTFEPPQKTDLAKTKQAKNAISWETFSPELVEKLQSERKIIFVNFTAAWCFTCKVNEKLVFQSKRVQEIFKKENVHTLLADWTSRDPVITKALAKHGRFGVPLYLVYHPESMVPQVLPQLLTVNIMLGALHGGK